MIFLLPYWRCYGKFCEVIHRELWRSNWQQKSSKKTERRNYRTQFNADKVKGKSKITLETYPEFEAAHSQP